MCRTARMCMEQKTKTNLRDGLEDVPGFSGLGDSSQAALVRRGEVVGLDFGRVTGLELVEGCCRQYNEMIKTVGKSQSCMVSKLRIIWKQTVYVLIKLHTWTVSNA